MKFALLLFPVLALCAVARAESPDSIPDPRQTNHSSIYDGAHVLSDTDKQRIDARVGELKKATGAQMTIVLVQTLDGMPVEEFANTLGRRIGVGQKGKDDGVLFLFAIKDHKSRLEVGPGLQDRLTDARVTAILRDQIRPAFKNGAYGEGIFQGVQVASNYIQGGSRPTTAPQAAPSSGSSSPSTNGSESSPDGSNFPSNSGSPSGSPSNSYYPTPPSPGGGLPGGLLLMGVLAAGGIGALMYAGSRPRKCPRCQTAMQQSEAPVSELSLPNQCEQVIGSRRFTRFGCPKCNFSQIESHTNPFSGYTRCDACNNLTAQGSSVVLQQPDYNFNGVQETTETCVFPPCRHVSRHQHTLPRLHRSSSVVIIGGGMGGFGGGLGNGGWGGGDSGGSSGGGGYDGGLTDSSGAGDFDGGGGSSDW